MHLTNPTHPQDIGQTNHIKTNLEHSISPPSPPTNRRRNQTTHQTQEPTRKPPKKQTQTPVQPPTLAYTNPYISRHPRAQHHSPILSHTQLHTHHSLSSHPLTPSSPHLFISSSPLPPNLHTPPSHSSSRLGRTTTRAEGTNTSRCHPTHPYSNCRHPITSSTLPSTNNQ